MLGSKTPIQKRPCAAMQLLELDRQIVVVVDVVNKILGPMHLGGLPNSQCIAHALCTSQNIERRNEYLNTKAEAHSDFESSGQQKSSDVPARAIPMPPVYVEEGPNKNCISSSGYITQDP